MVVSLDLLSGLTEGLGNNIEPLVSSSSLIPLLHECAKDSCQDVRQSSFALLGDLTKVAFVRIKPQVGEFMEILAQNLSSDHISVCNNAIWAIGEICVQLGAEMDPYAQLFVEPLILIINRTDPPKTLHENTAITIGRLSYVCPNVIAPRLASFIGQWCIFMRNIKDNDEKDSAFHGICNLITINPSGVLNNFMYFCDAVASWSAPKEELESKFRLILHEFKSLVGEADWQQFWSQCPEMLRNRLSNRYNL